MKYPYMYKTIYTNKIHTYTRRNYLITKQQNTNRNSISTRRMNTPANGLACPGPSLRQVFPWQFPVIIART